MNYGDHIWAKKPSDLPPGTHYVILEFSSIYIEGDQRSRDCPWHGYPAHTEDKVDCIVYKSRMAWEEEVRARTVSTGYGQKLWVPLIVKRPEIVTTFVTKIE